MTTDITGRLIYDPNVILMDMTKALQFYSGLLALPFSVETQLDDMIIDVPDYGLTIFIDEEHIHVGELVVIPGVHSMPNGDPGYPDETDQVDRGSFTFDKKNDAINRAIAILAISMFNYHGEVESVEAYAEELAEEKEIPLISTVEIPGSNMNHLRRGEKALQEQGK